MRFHRFPPLRYACILYLFSWGTGQAHAQITGAVSLDPEKALTQYSIDVWNEEDGLPQSTINAVVQTPDGYLWAATQEGLARFDGSQFKVFDRRTEDAIRNNEILALAVGRDGTLWFGTNGGGLGRHHEGEIHVFTTSDGLSFDDVGALFVDAEDILWIGTRAGLNRYSQGIFTTYTMEDGLASNEVLAIHGDSAGNLWIGTRGGLSLYKDGQFTSYTVADGLTDPVVGSVYADGNGAVWIGTYGGGLNLLRDGQFSSFTTREGLSNDIVWFLFEDSRGTLWAATWGGLNRFEDGSFSALTSEEGLADDIVLSLHEDREGSLWVGTASGGLNRILDGKFDSYTTREGLSHNYATTILQDASGALWIGTRNGLNRFEDGRFTTFTTANGLSSNEVLALAEDSQGDLWIGTEEGGLNRYQNGRFTTFTKENGLSSDYISSIYERRDGSLWIGTIGGGLNVYRDGAFTSITSESGLSHDMVHVIHEDRTGILWVGTRMGLNKIEDDRITAFGREDGLSSNWFVAIHEDEEGTLWFGTLAGGLIRYREEAFTSYTSRDGLFSDTIYQILSDDDDNLWMSCNKGIFKVSKQQLNDFAAGRVTSFQSVDFGRADGLKRVEANGGFQPAGWRARDGRLWFPTISGIVAIDPSNITINRLPPPVAIEQLVVNNREIPVHGDLRLPAGTTKLEIDYTGLSFIAPGKMQFRFRLHGVDEEWMEAGTRRAAYYTNLKPGTYRFAVVASNNDGIWSEQEARLGFEILPFFYQTSLFYLMCGFLLLLGVFGAYRFRIRHLRAREMTLRLLVRERTRNLEEEKKITETQALELEKQAEKLLEIDRIKSQFFSNISHEFRTPLTLTIGPLENALNGSYGPVTGELKQQLANTLRNSHRLLALITQLLDLSKLESGKMGLQLRRRNFNTFLSRLVDSFESYATLRRISLSYSSPVDDLPLHFDTEKLEKVFSNLISNALKFTTAGGKISVAINPSNGHPAEDIRVSVVDTGQGIPREHLPYVFDRFHQVEHAVRSGNAGTGIGLSLAKELVELHGGTIEVESTIGAGSEFVVILPTDISLLREYEVIEEPAEAYNSSQYATLADHLLPVMDHLSSPSDEEPASLQGAETLLIIDDNKDMRDYIRSCLHPGFKTAFAGDGVEGLAVTKEIMPDLIICDLMMPEMDGYTLCRHVKSDPALNHIPVILLTARAGEEDRLEGLELGADDYMEKPFNARELVARVQNLIQLRRQEKELKHLNTHLEREVEHQIKTILAERERYESDLIAAKEKAEESAHLKSEILANMNHEFRTPLTAILGIAQTLTPEVTGEHREFMEHIEENGMRLLRTLNTMLELSQLTSEAIQLNYQLLDFRDRVTHVVNSLRPLAQRKGLKVRTILPEEEVLSELDQPAVDRILRSLFDNAIKFSHKGDIIIETGSTDGYNFVSVQDSGIGIGEEFMPQLFEEFKQESTGLSRIYEGSGLGLAIVKRLTALMNGTIEVQTEKGKGSTFTVRFPQAIQETELQGISGVA